jgi:hypothetical protein
MTEDIDTVANLMQIYVSINLSYLKMGSGREMYHLRLELPLVPPPKIKIEVVAVEVIL